MPKDTSKKQRSNLVKKDSSNKKDPTRQKTKSTREAFASESDTIKTPSKVHALLRVRAEGGLTINSHHQVIAKTGRVLFGKLGKEISPSLKKELFEQIDCGIPTYLFLAVNGGWNEPFQIYECKLKTIHTGIDSGMRSLIPNYLHSYIPAIKTWFEITSVQQAERGEVNKIHIKSSGRCVTSSLRGAVSLFRVGLDNDLPLRTLSELKTATRKTMKLNEKLMTHEDFSSVDDLDDLADIVGWRDENF